MPNASGSQAKTDNRNYNVAAYASKMDEIGRMLKHELVELNKYVSRRSTDRELNRNVEKIISNIHKRYMLEVSKTVME